MLRSTSNVLKQVFIKIIHKYNKNIRYYIIKKKFFSHLY